MSNDPSSSYPPTGGVPPIGAGSPTSRPMTGVGAPASRTERGGSVGETVDTAKHEATKLASELEARGGELGEAAKERAKGFAEEQKSLGADHLDGVARAVKKAAEELQDSAPQLAGHIQDTASAMERMSRTLRERGVGEIAGDITDFARRQPVAFLGASIVAGLALSRFLKSSAEPAYRHAEPSRTGTSSSSASSTVASMPGTPTVGAEPARRPIGEEPARSTTGYQGASHP